MSNEMSPMDVEVYWQRLTTICDECWSTAHRTAFSPIITEGLDLACEVMDRRGRVLAHATRSIPSFTTALPAVTKTIISRWPSDELREGDIFLTNDPWLCAGHLPDPALVAPVFHRGRHVGFVGSIGHASDMGGLLKRSEATELYEEGLQIPICKLYRAGVPDETLLEVLSLNIRDSHILLGDFEAQITAIETARRRLEEFLEDYDFADLETLSDVLQEKSERAMRRVIGELPDGTYTASTMIDGFAGGQPLEVSTAITIDGSSLVVDFPDCPPQLPKGGVNSALSYTRSHVLYALHCILGPAIASNDGCYAPFTVTAPEGSILNCTRPASVGLRMLTGWHVHPLVHSALSAVVPDQVIAPSGTMSWSEVFGEDASGGRFHDHMVIGTGLGASSRADGRAGTSYPSSAASVPVEVVEARSPLLVERKEFIPDSGGAGRHRGGLGQRLVLRMRPGAARSATLSLSLDHRKVPASGLFGGSPGRTAALLHDDGHSVRHVEESHLTITDDEERIIIELSAGGGYGSPSEREPDLVDEDLSAGWVTSAPE